MIIIAVTVFITFIIIAHIFAPQGYSWKSETVSRLADSENSRAWILRTGMISYGIILIIATLELSFPAILTSIYGLGLISTGIFTVERHKNIHMFSIYTAGAALIIAMFWLAITGDMVSMLCLASMIIAEILFNIKALVRWRGVSQRIVHLSSLIWLVTYSLI